MQPLRRFSTKSIEHVSSNISALDTVLYIDRGVVVLNKPTGLVCQPQPENGKKLSRTQTDFATFLHDLQSSYDLGGFPYPVHRLDKRTTGALVLARNIQLARELSRQFRRRAVQKTYLALCWNPDSPQPSAGQIRNYVNKDPDGYMRMSAENDPKGKRAETNWEVLTSSPYVPVSLIRFELLTGLKHQLRMHAGLCMNAPILGDALYMRAPMADLKKFSARLPEDRIFLHSSHIVFNRYGRSETGNSKPFRLGVAASLPSEFITLCNELAIDLSTHYKCGGLFVDGMEVPEGIIPEVDGRWLRNVSGRTQ